MLRLLSRDGAKVTTQYPLQRLMTDADDIARVAQHLEGIAHTLEQLMPAVRAVRSSIIGMGQSVAKHSEFVGSHEELEGAIIHGLGLDRIDAARRRIVAAVHHPFDDIAGL